MTEIPNTVYVGCNFRGVILELYLPSSVKITSVKLEADNTLVIITISSILMIQSGMVRDAGVPVLAVSSTIHRGSASNSLNQLPYSAKFSRGLSFVDFVG